MPLDTIANETLAQIEERHLRINRNIQFWNTDYTPAEVEALSQFSIAMHDLFGDTTWNALPKDTKATPKVSTAYGNFERLVYDRLKKEGKFIHP